MLYPLHPAYCDSIVTPGKREPGEEPLAACMRELREEMQWEPERPQRACDLYVDGELIAWFFEATGPGPEVISLRVLLVPLTLHQTRCHWYSSRAGQECGPNGTTKRFQHGIKWFLRLTGMEAAGDGGACGDADVS